MKRLLPLASLVSIVLPLAACGGNEAPRADNACTPDSAGAPWSYADAIAPGPHAVGTLELTLVDSTRGTAAHGNQPALPDRTLLVSVWYPAATSGAGVPAATDGPFPIVGYSHGFSSDRGENPGLANHLASHGYIVVAPSFPLSNIHTLDGPTSADLPNQPGDLSFLFDTLIAYDADGASPLFGAVDETRVAVTGLSMGGATTLLTTFHPTLRDPRVDVAVALTPAAEIFGEGMYATTNTPLLIVHGTSDAILEYQYNGLLAFHRAQAPVSLLTLDKGTHTGFTSIATIFEDTEGYENIDTLGCSGLDIFGGGVGAPPDLYTLLGGEAAGMVRASGEAEFCPADLQPAMKPSRQLEITNAAVLSFFEAYLSLDVTTRGRACAFSERELPRAADIALSRR